MTSRSLARSYLDKARVRLKALAVLRDEGGARAHERLERVLGEKEERPGQAESVLGLRDNQHVQFQPRAQPERHAERGADVAALDVHLGPADRADLAVVA